MVQQNHPEATNGDSGMQRRRNIRIKEAVGPAIGDKRVEIVERKGLGHPDSICDGVAEAVAQALCQEYLDRFGKILHFNTDETQLVAGKAATQFGGGTTVAPTRLLIVGRATKEYQGETIPAEKVALEANHEYLEQHFPELEVGTDIIPDIQLGEGSGDLQDVFGEDDAVPRANDTSYGVGFAPLTETERIVKDVENRLNGSVGAQHPAIGQDIKIMAKREDDHIDLTVAVAVVDKHVDDMEAYHDVLETVEELVSEIAARHTDKDITVHTNNADTPEEDSVYLTTTGTSAEMGDDGSVGRGNRANGLITPDRPMSMEASSGKNPVNHVGKIYNLLSTEIAHAVVDNVDGIKQLHLRLVSQIGRPIDEPHVASAEVITQEGYELSDLEAELNAEIDAQLSNITDLTKRVINGELTTF